MSNFNSLETNYSDGPVMSRRKLFQVLGLMVAGAAVSNLAACTPVVSGETGQLPPIPTPDLNPNDDPGVVIEPFPEGLSPPPFRGPRVHPSVTPTPPLDNPSLKTIAG